MIWYQVWDGDGDSVEQTTSLKKAGQIFDRLSKRYKRVVLDKWEGVKEAGEFEGDYAETVKEYKAQA